MTGLCIMPLLVLVEHKNPMALLFRVIVQQDYMNSEEYSCMNISIWAVVGAWLGALAIPLDWGRWWQEWPISCSFGAVFGSLLGALISFKLKRNRKQRHS
jgi:phosphatidylinositol glycan class F